VFPAHVLVQKGRHTSMQLYWQPDLQHRVIFRREEEYDENLRRLLTDAVRSALRSNGPVCTDVSGGLDSSTVTSVAASLKRNGEGSDHELIAHSSIASQTAVSDERHFQKDLLVVYPLRAIINDMDLYRYFEALDTQHVVAPSTGIFSGSRAKALTALFESEGIRVHLTGLGGDQVFCGDQFPPVHLSEWLRTLQWTTWIRGMRDWLHRGDRNLWSLLWYHSRASLPRVRPNTWNIRSFNFCVPAVQMELLLHERETERAERRGWQYSSTARAFQYRSIARMQPGGGYRFPGWERRYPLLYRPLVEFMLAIPWEEKIRSTEDRVIQRRALKHILPESIRTRKDKGDHTPLVLKCMRENWSNLRPFTSGRRLADLGIVDSKSFETALARLRHGVIGTAEGATGPVLAAALSLEMWLALREQQADSTFAADKEWLLPDKTQIIKQALKS
jgi:asparagine synthase (glutamine-hydrolysing)